MPEFSPAVDVPGPGDLIGGITDIVGGAVGEATSSALNAFSAFLWGAGLEILQTGIGLADHVGSVNLDLTAGPLAAVWPVTLGIGCSLAAVLFYVQLVTVSAGGGRGLMRALQGCAQFGIALAAAAGVFTLLVLAADGITSYILQTGLESDSFAAAFDKTGFSDTTANAIKGPSLALLSIFGFIPIGLGFAFENVMRAATIYLLVAVIPITAAGLLTGSTRSWFWKTANWAMAAIAVKPVMALALWIGVAIAGSGSGLAQLITGLALMFVSLWAPLALFKLFAFTSTSATDAFKSGWGEAQLPDTSGLGSQGSSSPDSANSSIESSTDARYSSTTDDWRDGRSNSPSTENFSAEDGHNGHREISKEDVAEAGSNVTGVAEDPISIGRQGERNVDNEAQGDTGSPTSSAGPGSKPSPGAASERTTTAGISEEEVVATAL